MNNVWRLIIDPPSNGFYNMAVDEYLLQHYREFNQPILRIYSWKPELISIGYSQDPKDVLISFLNTSYVRRQTGGSAILHDDEITYSLCLSVKDLDLAASVKQTYKQLCGFLIDFYQQFGLIAGFAQDILPDKVKAYAEFCFSSFQDYDLIIQGKKIGGNAQRRSKDLIFQHGSIPRFIDREKIARVIKHCPDLTQTAGICELAGKDISLARLQQGLIESFRSRFKVKFKDLVFDQKDKQAIKQIEQKKYA